MATPMDLRNKWVLVTGASSGLGAEMAKQLAWQHGAHVLLLARRENQLQALQNEILRKSQGQCACLCSDLSKPEAYAELFQQIISNYPISAVILNAGVTFFDEDLSHHWEDFQNLLHTNVNSVVYFTRACLKYFDAQQADGAVLVIGSVAGLIPVPYQSVYSGSKAFLCHYCLGVSEEIAKKPYSLSLFAPGGINTEMNSKSGLAHYFSGDLVFQSVESCAAEALHTLRYRKAFFVPRFINRLQVFASKFVPKTFNSRIAGTTYRKALSAKRNRQ